MFGNNRRFFMWFFVCMVMHLSMDGALAQLQRPTRPEKFSSPEEVIKYVNAVKQHIRLTSPRSLIMPRFGKRTFPSERQVLRDEQVNEEPVNSDKAPDEELGDQDRLYKKLFMLHQLPTEWQQMKKLQSAHLSSLPLTLLRKYLHLHFDENEHERIGKFSDIDPDIENLDN